MKLSIVIVSYNCKEELQKCLLSIYSYIKIKDYEIIVIDNNSLDNTAVFIKNNYPEIKIISNLKNLGFAKGVNCGIKISKGEYILLLNPDTEIIENSIEKLLKYLDNNSKCGCIGPKLLNSDKSHQTSAYSFPTLFWAFLHLIRIIAWFPKNKILKNILQKFFINFAEPRESKEVNWLTGACLCIRKKTIDDIGLFDENFFLYFEEIDWCKRAVNKGWKIIYYPCAEVIHHLQKSSCKNQELSILSRYKSMFYYFRKNHGIPQSIVVRIIAIIIFFVRAIYYIIKRDIEKLNIHKKLIKLSFGKEL